MFDSWATPDFNELWEVTPTWLCRKTHAMGSSSLFCAPENKGVVPLVITNTLSHTAPRRIYTHSDYVDDTLGHRQGVHGVTLNQVRPNCLPGDDRQEIAILKKSSMNEISHYSLNFFSFSCFIFCLSAGKPEFMEEGGWDSLWWERRSIISTFWLPCHSSLTHTGETGRETVRLTQINAALPVSTLNSLHPRKKGNWTCGPGGADPRPKQSLALSTVYQIGIICPGAREGWHRQRLKYRYAAFLLDHYGREYCTFHFNLSCSQVTVHICSLLSKGNLNCLWARKRGCVSTWMRWATWESSWSYVEEAWQIMFPISSVSTIW